MVFTLRPFRCLVTFLTFVIAASSTIGTRSSQDTSTSNIGTSPSIIQDISRTHLPNLATSSSLIDQPETSAESTPDLSLMNDLGTSTNPLLQCYSGDSRWSNPCGVRQKRSRYDEDLQAELEGTRHFINRTKDFIFEHYIKQPWLRSQLSQESTSIFSSNHSENQDKYEDVAVNLYGFVANIDYLTTCGTNRVAESNLKQKLGQINRDMYRSLCNNNIYNHTLVQWEDMVSRDLVEAVATSSGELSDIMIIYITISEVERSVGYLEQLISQ